MSALLINSIRKNFGVLAAARDVDLTVAAGSRTAIVGPSGSGKTTLLRMIAGFEFPDAGVITLNGEVLADGPRAVPAHQRRIGYVPQDGALFPHLSIAANIGFGLPASDAGTPRRVAELMEMVALEPRLGERWPHELSGGQQQRVALARALAQRPQLMLLDEPFSALDTGLRAALRKVVSQVLADAGVTTVLVTHDQAEALSFADQIAVMRQGRLVQVGAPRTLYRHPRDEETALFLGDAIVLPARIAAGWAYCELGRVAVGEEARAGAARIMLRPEQLELIAVVDGDPAADACLARVTECDFSGHASVLSVQLLAAPGGAPGSGAPRVIAVRGLSLHAPPVGSTVRVGVDGLAHVLAD